MVCHLLPFAKVGQYASRHFPIFSSIRNSDKIVNHVDNSSFQNTENFKTGVDSYPSRTTKHDVSFQGFVIIISTLLH